MVQWQMLRLSLSIANMKKCLGFEFTCGGHTIWGQNTRKEKVTAARDRSTLETSLPGSEKEERRGHDRFST